MLPMSSTLSKLIGNKGLAVVERLVGLLLAAITVQMLLVGIKHFVTSLWFFMEKFIL